MKKVNSIVLLTLLLTSALAMLLTAIPQTLGQTILFQEDFESRTIGSFPSDKFYSPYGPWSVQEESGNKFLRSPPGDYVDYLLYSTWPCSGDMIIEYDERFVTGRSDTWFVQVLLTNSIPRIPGCWALTITNDRYGTVAFSCGWSTDGSNWIYGPSISGPSPISVSNGVWYDVRLVLLGSVARFYVNSVFVSQYDLNALIPYPIANVLLTWMTWGQRSLDNITITQAPILTVNSAYDSPTPSGTSSYAPGTSITASVTSPVAGPVGTQYVCTSWTGTGDVPASGMGTSVPFTIGQDSTITWNWMTQHYLTVNADPASAPVPAGAGWYDASSGVPLTAVAGYKFENRDYLFSYWDVDGVNQGQGVNPITVTLNAAHTATAHYKMIPVGGEWVPINTVQMLVQLVGSVVAMSAIVASFIGFKRIKKKQN